MENYTNSQSNLKKQILHLPDLQNNFSANSVPVTDNASGNQSSNISSSVLSSNHNENSLHSNKNADENKKIDHNTEFADIPVPDNKMKNISIIKVATPVLKSLQKYDAESPNQIANKFLGQREELMELFMARLEDDYTSKQSFRIFAGTWNVNGQSPPLSVKKWIGNDPDPPDVYALGFQELDLSKEAFVFSESSREEEWLKVVSKSLHPNSQYHLVKVVRLVGMMLTVYVKQKHSNSIKNVVSHYVGTGLLGRMGNKGAVAVRFKLHNSTFCIVNSHLAAHAELIQRRNEDYVEIQSRMRFADPNQQGSLSIFQHDFLIWVGDLNYRIDGLQPEIVKDLVNRNDYKLLKENDQLLCQRREKNVFLEFQEGEINFRPTYKYNPGTDVWDTSEKCRTPAWCDRILWREASSASSAQKKKTANAMELVEYRSHPELKISDHKPVSSLFNVKVKVVDNERYRQVYEDEIRRLDRMENDWLPTMKLSCHSIEFGDVTFHRPVTRLLELHNTGQVPCHFEFIAKFEESSFCKPWLTILKPNGFVMPNEKMEIQFEVYVNRITASDLNLGQDKIEDILILHLVGGKDFFITVSGQYLPSFFGMPLDVLCKLNKPVRKTPQSEIQLLKQNCTHQDASSSSTSSMKVPKELFRILDHLYYNALKQADLFQQPGLHKELQEIQECLDLELPSTTDPNKLPGSNHSVVEALLVFLESLPDPVIPFDFYPLCLEVSNDFQKSIGIIDVMPECHRYVFYYLISFIQELFKYKDSNGLELQFISNVFSGLVLRPKVRKPGLDARVERRKATKFIENFLVNEIEDTR